MHADIIKIAKRRFGSRHEKPCNNPRTLTCALWECQVANKCQESPLVGKWRRDDNVRALDARARQESER